MNIALLAALACPALMCGPMAVGMIRHRLRRNSSPAAEDHSTLTATGGRS
jgi:hypothetical protein